MKYRLRTLPGHYAVCQLPGDAEIPGWAAHGAFWQILRSPGELAVVCLESQVPPGVAHESAWRILEVEGPLSFDLSGVLHTLLTPLARCNIAVLSLAGYSTDFLLVRELSTVVRVLQGAGHTVY